MAEQSREKLQHYLSATKAGPFNRIAKGFEELGNALNPQEQTRTYIDGASSTVTTGFQPSWSFTGNVYSDDTVNKLLLDKAIMRAKGDDAIVWMLNVYTWEEEGVSEYRAYLQECTWMPGSDGGGSGEGDVEFSGEMRAKGDPIHGAASITVVDGKYTATFTPAP